MLSQEILTKAIKKAYVEQITDEVQQLVNKNESLVKTIEALNAKLEKMTKYQEELEHKVKSPEYECAIAIRNMMQTTIQSQTPEIVQEQVLKHATVNITTPTENDPFKYSFTEIGWE